MRTIAFGYKDLKEGDGGPQHQDDEESGVIKEVEKTGFTLICIFGIMDIVRPEVPGAIKEVNKAGVTVRMVTGDNLITAMAIAKNCGIITEE